MSESEQKFEDFYPDFEGVQIGETLIPTVPLIEFKENGFRVNSKTLENISKIELKISVVGICGPMKLGKSFFLNILFKEKGGFRLSRNLTFEPHAEGIYVWGKKAVVKGEEICLLLLDTDFSDSHHDEEFVNKIQCLMVLLSGTFVYNTFSEIDYNSIKRLNFVSKMSQYFHNYKSDLDQDFDDFPSYRPRTLAPLFIWILRDVFLKPYVEGIEEPTDDEYMDYQLATYAEQKRYKKKNEEIEDDETDDPVVLAQIAELDHIKSKFRSFFPFRECFRLVRPIIDEQLLQNVEHNVGEVRNEFISRMKEVIAYVYKNIHIKKFRTPGDDNVTVDCNGKVYSVFTKDVVSRVNTEEYIDLQPISGKKKLSMKEKKVLKDQMKMMRTMMSMLQKQMKVVSSILGDEKKDEDEENEGEGED